MSGPKLLDKKIINAEVATQKKQQIDSGIAMAKKVDVIRENLQTEETNLELFRTETLKIVREEIDGEHRKLKLVKDAVKDQELKLSELQIPLDNAWAQLNTERVKLQSEKDDLEQKSDSLSLREQEIERSEQEIEIEKGRIAGLKHQASEMLTEADTTLTNARNASVSIRKSAGLILEEINLKVTVLDTRENALETRERAVEQETRRQLEVETDLANREKKLRSRQELFIKSQNYLKNKNTL